MPLAISAAPAVPPNPTTLPRSLGESAAPRCSLEDTQQLGQLSLAVHLESNKLQSSQGTADPVPRGCQSTPCPRVHPRLAPKPPHLSFPPAIALLPPSYTFINEGNQTVR